MSNFQFANPQWFHLLWAIIIFIGILYWCERRGSNALTRFISIALQSRLVKTTSAAQKFMRLFFLLLAGIFITLALMRPQWGLSFVATPRLGAEIMVCLDVSRSMLAEDVAPNRLERAKTELRDLLTYLEGDQVGLIAFAGRATVLSPLTPDFGFFRLVLDRAGPHSVSRGGTRLEEPIRKAVAGFANSGDFARIILLITDGEDQDSFPLEAAKQAMERGIRIIAIGFGAESGSEILITDPNTGVKNPLRDGDGNIVKSRLDGDLLREIALLSKGAYIPAGTGVLDLESIYRRHMQELMRAPLSAPNKSVRNDAYQWAVLLALLCLFAAVISTGRQYPKAGQLSHNAAFALLSVITLYLLVPAIDPAAAQPPSDKPIAPGATRSSAQTNNALSQQNTKVEAEAEAKSATPGAQSTKALPEDARAAFNMGLARMQNDDIESAKSLFLHARSQAGADGEARFRATYNMGWAEVKAADAQLESEPQEALQALQRAAGWFREAIALRQTHGDSRYNLDVVLRRISALADSLAEKEDRDLLIRINEGIELQRAYLGEYRNSIDILAARNDPHAVKQQRQAMRSLSSRQLQILTEVALLSERAGSELDTIKAAAGQDDMSAEKAMRGAQLEQALGYLQRARERMGQTRGQLRRLRAERGFRRASDALNELKRARDQLLDPVTRIDDLLRDGLELARLTSAKAALTQQTVIDAGADTDTDTDTDTDAARAPAMAPAWLSHAYLRDAQESLEQRTGELYAGLQAGLARYARQDSLSGKSAPAQDPASQREQEKLMRQLADAEPLIGGAEENFALALEALSAERPADAMQPQNQALRQLNDARELFLDLRRLIEVLYEQEQQIAGFINKTSTDGNQNQNIAEFLPLALEMQNNNRLRGARVGTMIAEELIRALDAEENAQQSATQAGGVPQPALGKQQKQLFEQADQLQLAMQRAIQQASDHLAAAEERGDTESLVQARTSVELALAAIEELRRLFFSVLEHLRETARYQMELGDETETIAALSDEKAPPPGAAEETARQLGPLAARQQDLAQTAGALSNALQQQASAATERNTAPSPADSATGTAPATPGAEQLNQAAAHVATAGQHMNDASVAMLKTPAQANAAREQQEIAVQELLQAIALLQPPEEKNQQNNQNQQPQQNQAEQQPDRSENDQEQEREPENAPADMSQLLQGIRDRDAQRQQQKTQQKRGYEPVAKDW